MFDKAKTRILMISSAVFMGIMGLGISFFPQELLEYFGTSPDNVTVMIVKIAGGLYFGFGFLNWMARDNIIGAIYSRPVAVGNCIHFMMGAIILFKEVLATSSTLIILSLAVVNAVFAVSFGYLLFAGGKSCQ